MAGIVPELRWSDKERLSRQVGRCTSARQRIRYLISCRNLLIYLQREAEQRIFSVFHFALNEGGYLFLGSSESVERSGDLFETVNATNRIYKRTSIKAFPPTGRDDADLPAMEFSDDTTVPRNDRPSQRIGGQHLYDFVHR